MSDKTYVDPNSGAAPQPGGYAGPEAAEKGFATQAETREEIRPSEYVAPGGNPEPKSVDEIAQLQEERKGEKDEDEQKQQLVEAVSNPKKVLADLDEDGTTPAPEVGAEEEAADNASIEHQAVDPSQAGEDDGQAKGDEAAGGAYDPSAYSVEEVNAYLAENPDQRDAVVASEKDGKNRKGITGE